MISKLMRYLKRCDCGRKATWVYMPSNDWCNPYFCDECIPRGCSCTKEDIREEYYGMCFSDIYNNNFNLPNKNEPFIKWINDYTWCRVDEQLREFPCCEFWPVENKNV